MDAPCKIQRSIHVFRLVNNMCPGKWVHITLCEGAFPLRVYPYEKAPSLARSLIKELPYEMD